MSERILDPLCQPASHDADDIWNANITPQPSPADPSPSKGTKLTDLPDKCLVSIFKWIPLQNLDDIIEMSPHWDKLVQEHIPVEVHLTDIGFRIAMHYFIGHTDLPKYRVKVIHSRVLDEPLPELKSPEDLQVLDFATHTEMATYKHLIGKADNLQELYFSYSSLTSDPINEVDVELPKLKVLYMADRTVDGKIMDPVKASILPRNITGFLGKTLPSIRRIVICTVATRKQTIDYAKELLKFIQRHSETLKFIKVNVSTSIQTPSNQTGQINDLVEFSSNEEEFNMGQLANVKLADIDVNVGRNFFCGLEQWRWILQHQKGLEHLTIGTEKPLHPQIFEAPITLSASNLVTVQIGVQVYDKDVSPPEERRVPLDCSIFENCANLKMLVLNGPPTTTNDADERAGANELSNLGKLPKGLYALGIENIYLETKQIAEFTRGVMQKERVLERLSLQNIGTSQGFGVTLAMLDCWITSQVLEEIIVKCGLNADETRLHEYEHLIKFGVTSPIAKCMVHAYYYPNFMEYRKPAEFNTTQHLNLPFM